MRDNPYKDLPPLERRPDGSLYRMTPAQRKQAASLIRRECCCCEDGNCIALDDGDTCTCPQTAQCFKSLSRKISASSVPSSGKTAQRNHLQQTEKEIVCGQVQVSPSSRTMQLPSSQQQHSRRIRLAACFLCAGVMR